jgi:hypothetical protein
MAINLTTERQIPAGWMEWITIKTITMVKERAMIMGESEVTATARRGSSGGRFF